MKKNNGGDGEDEMKKKYIGEVGDDVDEKATGLLETVLLGSRDREMMREQPSFKSRRVLITPEMALVLLEKNTNNRVVREAKVERYALLLTNMAKGVHPMWNEGNPSGCSIDVDTNDVLSAGQHRLLAIVRSGVALWVTLNTNVDPKTRETNDSGIPWTPGDYLHGTYGVENAQKVAAVVRVIHGLNTGLYNNEPEKSMLGELWLKNSTAIEWAMKALPRQSAPVTGAFAWAYAIGANARVTLDVAADQVATGEGCSRATALIRELKERKKNNTRIDRWQTSLLTLRLIEAHVLNEALTRMPFFKIDDETVLMKRVKKLLRGTAA